jgi:NMT1/THI5 like
VGQLRSVLRHYGKIAIFWKTRSIFIFTESDFMVHKVLFITIALVGVFLSQRAAAAEPAQKVRIGYPSSAVSTLPFDIAKEKGFYSKAGLDVEYIQMRTAIAPQAILNGNINFFTSPQSGISAAVSGLPLVVVLVLYKDTPWILVTSKEINQAQDLIGKKIAISDLRSSPYYFARAGFKKLGLDDKQVSLATTGGTSNSFAALTSNLVAGAVLSPPFDDKAVSLGFKKFPFPWGLGRHSVRGAVYLTGRNPQLQRPDQKNHCSSHGGCFMAAIKPLRGSQNDCRKIQGEPERSGAVLRYYDRSLV